MDKVNYSLENILICQGILLSDSFFNFFLVTELYNLTSGQASSQSRVGTCVDDACHDLHNNITTANTDNSTARKNYNHTLLVE